jgi:CRISPR-associated protein Cmr4
MNDQNKLDPETKTEQTMKAKSFFLHALTPLHVGAGRGLGYIDLPIVREKATNYPYIPGSSIKGVVAELYTALDPQRDEPKNRAAFGHGGADNANSGSLVFTDARLLFLPVRSLYGTFAYCTSPTILERYKRDLASVGQQVPSDLKEGLAVADDGILTAPPSLLVKDAKVYLEDLDLTSSSSDVAAKWAKHFGALLFPKPDDQSAFSQRFAILPDDIFNFLCETGTEVQPHVKIDDDKKTVVGGALWYEESLPTETILGGILWCDRVYGEKSGKPSQDDLFTAFGQDKTLQFGGKATTGKGLVRLVFENGGKK